MMMTCALIHISQFFMKESFRLTYESNQCGIKFSYQVDTNNYYPLLTRNLSLNIHISLTFNGIKKFQKSFASLQR